MEEVWSVFLRLMRDYEALALSEEEMKEVFEDNLAIALGDLHLRGVMEDVEYGYINFSLHKGFNRDLTSMENLIIGYALIVAWLSPYLYSSELLMAQLTSTDFTQFSSSNRLQTYIKLFDHAELRLNQAILNYDTRMGINHIREEVKKRV